MAKIPSSSILSVFSATESELFAEIIIPLALPKNYTWSIPNHLIELVKPGIRVEVVLGKHKKYAGIIKKLFNEAPKGFTPKPILNVLDSEPLINPEQLKLWEWIAQYYLCSEGEVMQAAVPANLKLSSESILIWNEDIDESYSDLNDEEFIVAEALELRKELRLSEVQQLLDSSHVYPIIKKLIDRSLCYVWEELVEKYQAKKQTYIVLHPDFAVEEKLSELLNNWGKAPKQMELLLSYLHLSKTEGDVIQSELLKKSNASAAQLKGLIEKGILIAEKRTVSRIGSWQNETQLNFELSVAQKKALEQIQEAFQTKQTCLLHGITASGKTQLYIHLIEQYMQEGKQVLYLLPEIALTSQIIRRLQLHFGNSIGIYHSKFNANERVEIWNKVKTGELKAVLGARSALLLPFHNLGLIIADEEHDASYKQQDPAPRYHARDTAIYYAGLFQAKVLLGSATPSVETYYNCSQDKYALVELKERFGLGELPKMELVDFKNRATTEEGASVFTEALLNQIALALEEKSKSFYFKTEEAIHPIYFVKPVVGFPIVNTAM